MSVVKRNLSSTRYDYIQNVLALKRAGGTITEKDLKDVKDSLSEDLKLKFSKEFYEKENAFFDENSPTYEALNNRFYQLILNSHFH